MLLSEKLKEIRRKSHLSQDAFANELSVSRQTIINWEKGKSTPENSLLNSIASKYNIDINSLIDDTKDIVYITDINKEEEKIETNDDEILYIAKRSLISTKFVLYIYFIILSLSLLIFLIALRFKGLAYYVIDSIILVIVSLLLIIEIMSRKSAKVIFYKNKYVVTSGLFNKSYYSEMLHKYISCRIEQSFFGGIFKYGNIDVYLDSGKIMLGGVKKPYKLKDFLEKTY
ncbi:MAG: helix-turn-helix domain-containing protein [Anaeroplasmataceae bacterium]